MNKSIRFPKNHEIFSSDKKFNKKIKIIEDRIELKYQSLELQKSLSSIIRLYEPPPVVSTEFEVDQELMDAMKTLMPEASHRDQLDIDRDAIWEMQRRAGEIYVLGFLSPSLMMSMETLFSGVVIGYVQMFNETKRRAPLSYNVIFEEDEEGKKFHEEINRLRNKQYAHKELPEGQHNLSYSINKNQELEIDLGGRHENFEFHPSMCRYLHKCISKVLQYLDKDITMRSKRLLDELTDEQRKILHSYWTNQDQHEFLFGQVSHQLINRKTHKNPSF